MVKLIFLNKGLDGKVYKLVLDKTTVGRSSDNTVAIHDNSVSSHHCQILQHGEEIIVRELGSTNGTFVNDRKVAEQMPVKSGQVIRFGEVEARLEFERPTRDRPDTEMTTVATLKEVGIERRQAKRDAEGTTHKELGDQSNEEEHTVVFEKQASSPSATAGEKPPVQEPLHVISEPGAVSRRWLVVIAAGVVVIVVLAILFWKVF